MHDFTYSSTLNDEAGNVDGLLFTTLLSGECDDLLCMGSLVSCCGIRLVETVADQQYYIVASRVKRFASGMDPAYDFDFKLSCPNSQVAQAVENSIPTLD